MMPDTSSHDQDEIDVQRWTRVLLRGWMWLVIGLIGGAALGWLAASRVPRIYEATTLVLLRNVPDDTGIFTAPGLQGVVIGQSISSTLLAELQAKGYNGTIQDLVSGLSVEPVLNTTTFQISARMPDPQLAATAAGRASELAMTHLNEQWREVSRRELQSLSAQRARARLLLTEAAIPDASDRAEREDTSLEREVRRKVYLDIAARHEQMRLQIESQPPQLVTIQAASVPRQPLPNSRRRTIMLGALAGLMLAACVVILREWRLSPATQSPAQV